LFSLVIPRWHKHVRRILTDILLVHHDRWQLGA
jgi:hypothetical protein